MILNCATDLHTRQTIWVPSKGDIQHNSHNGATVDGLTAADWSGLCTEDQGWQGPGRRYSHAPGAARVSWVA